MNGEAPLPSCTPISPLRSACALLVRLLLAGLFLFSAWQKVKGGNPPEPSGPQTFALSVRAFELLPDAIIPFTASAVAWTELLCAVALLLGLWTRAAAIIMFAAVVGFTLAVISVILRGLPITCGCFGKFKLFCSGPFSWCKVGENSVFLVLLAAAIVLGSGRIAMDSVCCRTKPAGR